MLPNLSTTIGWAFLVDPNTGFLNQALKRLPFIDESPFNIHGVQGIIFAHPIENAISHILLASRGTVTLSILALELMTHADGAELEATGIVSLVMIAMTMGVAFVARRYGIRVGLPQQ